MRLFAIDLSTDHASLALHLDGAATASRTWSQAEEPRQHVFTALKEFFIDTQVDPATLDHFVVGLGPGSFAGVRIAIAAANGYALPGGKRAAGVASSDAPACDFFQKEPNATLWVVGDARRNRLWSVAYQSEAGWPKKIRDFALCPLASVAEHIGEGATVITADGSLIGQQLNERLGSSVKLVNVDHYPDAGTIAALGAHRIQQQEPLDPPSPVYLHPAVFVEPSFPG
ncbi:MAG: tRNA (adenosine(37)-N6)-threonylcarbamoyltransferase complex dimerization subunit type 1 TsaB [Verrucomicrobia bacterium]|nr:tRNA (adenosine(37)-N6)-threonylcarbamoyltransferase complex dimerization subunit type 1 TsaB [Verrucomicrobiota bacterium]